MLMRRLASLAGPAVDIALVLIVLRILQQLIYAQINREGRRLFADWD